MAVFYYVLKIAGQHLSRQATEEKEPNLCLDGKHTWQQRKLRQKFENIEQAIRYRKAKACDLLLINRALVLKSSFLRAIISHCRIS